MKADPNSAAFVTARIVARYANPSRVAHLYLFQITPDADLTLLPPQADAAIMAWLDEDNGLAESPISEVIAHCENTIAAFRDRANTPQAKLSAHERRRQMARGVSFSIRATDDLITVELFSRSLAFAPRGDRRVTESWRRAADGGWYSAAIGRD